MNKILSFSRGRTVALIICLVLQFIHHQTYAQSSNVPLRRPVSAKAPMYLIHIDTWNYADPQKIIDLIPADIKPYVVFNISLSISHNTTTGQFQVAEYGKEIAKSWMRVCAENRVWAMVQAASGGMTQFSDKDLTLFEEFYKTYPNFLGFNYAEQFWGFGDPDPVSASWADRMNHLTNLLRISNKYGGYLVVSWCGSEGASINPIAMVKRNPAFAAASRQYAKNYILCEKYTMTSYQHDMESICLGAWLAGYSGNYGIRYDDSGWTDATGTHQNFTMATFGVPFLEHVGLTGQTVIDGPELIWTQCFRETTAVTTTNGYSSRNWTTFPQFDNVSVDLFKKVVDGSLRIPTRQEVIDRTKVFIKQDVNAGSDDNKYSSPVGLYDFLYRMWGDGTLKDNRSFFKRSGRYPTIPVYADLADATANSFQLKVNSSAYNTRWPDSISKVAEFNSLFPKTYSGNIYAGRHENNWVVYNPFKTNTVATGSIPFKYNTADSVELSLSRYTSGLIKEKPNELNIYLNNYDNVLNTGLMTNVIKVYGCTSEPAWSYHERANHQESTLIPSWAGGVFTLTVKHNGPLDITINASGTATGRLTSYTPAVLVAPEKPAAFAGPRQYEAEIFEYKNTSNIVTSGYNSAVRNYTGQGYLNFGNNAGAAVRKTVNVLQPGSYKLQTRYTATNGNINTVDLYVNGIKVITPNFTQTVSASDWEVNTQLINLNEGNNIIEFRANASAVNSLVLDNIVVEAAVSSVNKYHFSNDVATNTASTPAALVTTIRDGSAGVVSYTDANSNTSNMLKAYSNGSVNGTGVMDLDLFAATDNYSVVWKEYAGTNGGKKGFLLRGAGLSNYAKGLKHGYLFISENNTNNTVTLRPYVVNENGIVAQAAYSSSFIVAANTPCWYRATANGNKMTFECSKDSLNWEGAGTTQFTDDSYIGGNTQLVWGLGASNFSWTVDNISYFAPKLSVNVLSVENLSYEEGNGPSAVQRFSVNAQSVKDNLPIAAQSNFEISLNPATGFTNTITLNKVDDSIATTDIYVRLKSGLPYGKYIGDVTIGSEISTKISLKGEVTQTTVYNFTNDAATTTAANPPANNITIGAGNGATAGVVSFTDANSNTSNYLKIYGTGASSNATGVLDLNLFPTNAVDYSVTWKQVLSDATKQYKNGVVLRASGSGGYTQGIKQGYFFNAFNNNGANVTMFRIYKSTASGVISAFNYTSAIIALESNKPIWYRASVSGTTNVLLKFEYSADGINWKLGTMTIDNTAPAFTSGATQFVWGLSSTPDNFYLDDIAFSKSPEAAEINFTAASLTGYSYKEGAGPSTVQSFEVSGAKLSDGITLTAAGQFEISLNANNGFASSVAIPQSAGTLATTTVYARLKSGLTSGSYEGRITAAYTTAGSSFDQLVTLRGSVSKPMVTITVPTPLAGLGYVAPNGPSVVGSFAVSGSALSQNINISAPVNYEISLNENSGYTSSISLSPINEGVNSTIIYVRLATGLVAGGYNDNITITATGVDTQNIALAGSVSAQAMLYTSTTTLNGFGYNTNTNIPPIRSFYVWAKPITNAVTITAPANFELSRSYAEGYGSSIVVANSNAKVDSTLIFIRLKTGLAANHYNENVAVSSANATSKQLSVSGTVVSSKVYDFSNDLATAAATNPPANSITVSSPNNATGGVVSYMDKDANVSNRFKAYSGGQRNATGVMNLNLFPNNGTDYSVTWKQAVGSLSQYKNGVLLRGNAPVGTNITGYVEGMMQGYLFIAYTVTETASSYVQFRIYPSTDATNLPAYVNNQVSTLKLGVGENVWYRASVVGTNPVNLKFEYSTDNMNWITAATAVDNSTRFTSGATQLVWGLGTPNYNFFLDDITYNELNTLPVNLLTFTAKPAYNNAKLYWSTAQEVNNRGFAVQHRVDGNDFKDIAFINGNGNSTSVNSYTFTHHNPSKGVNYYRLKQIDLDGRSNYSEIVGLNFSIENQKLRLKENPVGSTAVLSYTDVESKKLDLKVIDATGKVMIQQQWHVNAGNNILNINTEQLSPGIYVLRIADNWSSEIIKMIKR